MERNFSIPYVLLTEGNSRLRLGDYFEVYLWEYPRYRTAQVSDILKLFFVTSFWGILMFAKLATVDITVMFPIQKGALLFFGHIVRKPQ